MMNDLEYLKLFRASESRPMVLQYFLERKYGVETLLKYSASTEEYPLPDYSSWVVTHLVKNFPNQMLSYQPLLIDAFLQSTNQTVLRNISVGFIHQPLIDYKEGELYDTLIRHLLNNENKVALHVNCIYKLIQFATKHPDLIEEINSCIDILLENNKQASLVSVCKKFKKKISKLSKINK